MSAAKLAAIRARVKAKEQVQVDQIKARVAEQRREWEEKEAKERETKKQEQLRLLAEKRAQAAEAAEKAASCLEKRKADESLPSCRCGKEAVRKTANKEGPNKGRTFISCAKGSKEFGGCGLFRWESDLQADAPDCPKCRCGMATSRRAVKKEGPNLGRQYFTCQQGRKEFGGCNFFEWVPDDEGVAAAAVPQTPKAQVSKVEVAEPATAEPAKADTTPPRPTAPASTLMSAYLTHH